MARAHALSGQKMHMVANALKLPVPENLQQQKGWVGEVIEQALGAIQGSAAGPDFPELGIELKTLPVKTNGEVKETTYVCTVPLTGSIGQPWEESNLYLKLKRVLWVPIASDSRIPPGEWHIGRALLWTPNSEQLAVLYNDWCEIMEKVELGDIETINAGIGEYLQVRPKAANNRALSTNYSAKGDKGQTLPRGFYLRTAFTNQLLKQHYHPDSPRHIPQ